MKYPLTEPQRWKDLLLWANQSFVWNDILVALAPVLADGIVFTYPILLVVWYVWWIQQKNDTYKYGALYVALSAVAVAVLAFLVQIFVDKSRPEWYIGNTDMLIMDHLPTAPFPSDHASVWFAVAVSTLLRAYRKDKKILKYIGWFLLVWALVMACSRVGVGIHWPTDVLIWAVLWTLVAWVLSRKVIWNTCELYIYQPLVRIQKWIFSKVGIQG
jgi:undecaprenyl-diphosphatase